MEIDKDDWIARLERELAEIKKREFQSEIEAANRFAYVVDAGNGVQRCGWCGDSCGSHDKGCPSSLLSTLFERLEFVVRKYHQGNARIFVLERELAEARERVERLAEYDRLREHLKSINDDRAILDNPLDIELDNAALRRQVDALRQQIEEAERALNANPPGELVAFAKQAGDALQNIGDIVGDWDFYHELPSKIRQRVEALSGLCDFILDECDRDELVGERVRQAAANARKALADHAEK